MNYIRHKCHETMGWVLKQVQGVIYTSYTKERWNIMWECKVALSMFTCLNQHDHFTYISNAVLLPCIRHLSVGSRHEINTIGSVKLVLQLQKCCHLSQESRTTRRFWLLALTTTKRSWTPCFFLRASETNTQLPKLPEDFLKAWNCWFHNGNGKKHTWKLKLMRHVCLQTSLTYDNLETQYDLAEAVGIAY